MREIKFRGYFKKEGMFVIDVLAIGKCSWDCPDFNTYGVSLAYQPHIPVMQYTEKKDKTSKEIYEGDILFNKITITQPQGELTTTIIGYVKTLNGMTYLIGRICQDVDGEELSVGKYKALFLHPEWFEVIGNIYENPELLEEE